VPVDFPPAPFFDGRFSNGPVWNERFLDDFLPGRSGNFAFGSARTFDNDDGIPDLDLQVAAFAAVRPLLTLGSRSLASLFFGSNDMFDAINAAVAAPGDVFGILTTGAATALNNIAAGVGALSAEGIDEFALWNLTDLGLTPRLMDLGPEASGLGSLASAIYNAGFETMVADLRTAGFTIHTVDTFGLFMSAVDDPAAFGLDNVTDACFPVDPAQLLNPTFVVPPVCATPDTFLYWDKLHPTRVGHDALAAAFDASVPAIPLPAPALLLLAGLGGLAALRRRAA
jgi:outer membrane lipase/esterase